MLTYIENRHCFLEPIKETKKVLRKGYTVVYAPLFSHRRRFNVYWKLCTKQLHFLSYNYSYIINKNTVVTDKTVNFIARALFLLVPGVTVVWRVVFMELLAEAPFPVPLLFGDVEWIPVTIDWFEEFRWELFVWKQQRSKLSNWIM